MAPTTPRDPRRLTAEVRRLQQNLARRSQGRSFAVKARWNASKTQVDYLYRDRQLICDEANLPEVLQAFPGRQPAVTDGPVGLKVLDPGARDAAKLAEELAGVLGEGTVTPNHVLDTQGHSSMCPATEPVPWVGPVSDLPEPTARGRCRAAVIDTGFFPPVQQDSGYARFNTVDPNSQEDDDVFSPRKVIQPYGGHGTSATAVLLSVAGANSIGVHVRDCLVGGGVDELTIVEDLETVINAGVDVISIQAGTYTLGGRIPKAFEAFYQKVLRHHPEVILTAAAGNDAADRPFWPAALPWCVAVGALTESGTARTGWTNYGHWVDVYSPGENVVVPFPNGTYRYLDGSSARFADGHALWSGTSFAAPAVAGMIARRMIERDVDAPKARDIVLADAAINALPTTGPRVLV
jgi:Subtilase family